MYDLALESIQRGDKQTISRALHKGAEEDPTMKVLYEPRTYELVLSGVSQLHLKVIRVRLKARFGVEVIAKEPKIPYRETIHGRVGRGVSPQEADRGRGQFAEVHLRLYLLPREIITEAQCGEPFANSSKFEKMRSFHDEMQSAAQLGGMRQGQGSLAMELSHYDMVPANVRPQIMSRAVLAKDKEE